MRRGKPVTWTGDANFGWCDIRFSENGAIFNNNGTFLAQSDQYLYDFSGTGAFNNAGSSTRNNNPGTLTLYNLAFNNTGTANVQTGTLDLQGGDGGSTTGVYNVSAGATLRFCGVTSTLPVPPLSQAVALLTSLPVF